MDVAVSKMSANGQVVIPAEMRRRLGLGEDTKFLIIEEGGSLVLKPLGAEALRREFSVLLEELHRAFREAGLQPEDVDRELAAVRKGRRRGKA